jgi:hypothetical protein
MTTIITITAEIGTISDTFYDYSGEDRILKNIMSGDYEVFYSGQNQGRLDYQLINSVYSSSTFRIYYRRKGNQPFMFLGSTTYSSIVKERTIAKGINSLPNERLQIRLVIPAANVSNIQVDTEFEGVGKYKKSILKHSGFDVDNVDVVKGFYTRFT